MKIIIFGANGGVGRALTERALTEGHQVTAVVRNPAHLSLTHSLLRVAQGDVTNAAWVDQSIQGHEMVFCTLGAGSRKPTTLYSTAARNVTQGMNAHGVRRLMFLSNFGVLDEKASDLRSRVLLLLAKLRLRDVLHDHRCVLKEIQQYSWEWMAVRPMILTDGPWTGHYRITLEGLPTGGARIARADVADFMLKQISSDEYVHKIPALAY
jgi:putative NADH-flavin reductase